MTPFGRSLKKLREERTLSQEELAMKAGVSAMTVSKVERGVHLPSNRTRRKLAAVLGMTLEEFEAEVKGAADVVLIEVPRDVYDGLVAKAERYKATLADYLRAVALGKGVVTRPEPKAGGLNAGTQNPAPVPARRR